MRAFAEGLAVVYLVTMSVGGVLTVLLHLGLIPGMYATDLAGRVGEHRNDRVIQVARIAPPSAIAARPVSGAGARSYARLNALNKSQRQVAAAMSMRATQRRLVVAHPWATPHVDDTWISVT